MTSPPFDSRKLISIYGDCCDFEKQYVRAEFVREALTEINRLRLVVQHLEQALEQERM